MLNDDKTEAIVTGSQKVLQEVNRDHLTIGDNNISFCKSVKNLLVYFDSRLTMETHVNHLISSLYLEIRRISKVRPIISSKISALLVNSLVLSKLDYCNSLLCGISCEKMNKLQIAQNNAARMVLKKSKREHASPLL